MDALLAEVDLAGVATAVTALLIVVVGLKMLFKGSDVAGRTIRKV